MNIAQNFQPGPIQARNDLTLDAFDCEIYYGGRWVSLNDMVNYQVAADSFSDRSQSRRRVTATSPVYDGTFEVHSVLENVTEQISVRIYGQSQNEVTENFLLLRDAFAQTRYNVRLRLSDHLETWLCMPAEWNLDRTHVYVHNCQAVMKLSIPRFPNPTYEVIM